MAGLTFETIVVPVDFSDQSFKAIDVALDIADGDASKVNVVHVLPELNLAEPGVIWHAIDHASRQEHAVHAMKERLVADKYQDLHLGIEFGDPGCRVAEHAKNLGAGLIVMPSHGRRGWQRLLIGSVAERITRLAHCPVLILRE